MVGRVVKQTVWAKLGVQRAPTSVADLLGDVANITVATSYRYVWRGVRDSHYLLQSSLERRLLGSGLDVEIDNLRHFESQLVSRAREAHFRPELSRSELLALLQHQGASTPLLDVTPDPFVALFFATEEAEDERPCALMAIRIPGAQATMGSKYTHKGPLPDGSFDSVYERLIHELDLPDDTAQPILWEAPFVDDRMRAQRGMFLATTAHDNAVDYGSFDLELEAPNNMKKNVGQLCDRSRGQYHRPAVVVFYISQSLRTQVARELDLRFGYRTESIYPDLGGFAQANSAGRRLQPRAKPARHLTVRRKPPR